MNAGRNLKTDALQMSGKNDGNDRRCYAVQARRTTLAERMISRQSGHHHGTV
jgi:hypothetical protein